MKYDMKKWLSELITDGAKRALPILSFPCVSLIGISVKELISDSALQAKGIRLVAERTDAAAAVSFMDLSVEAECFGAQISVSDDEVPTVKDRIINSEDDADALLTPEVGGGRTALYIEAIKKASETITDRPVLAGMIGPFSLAARLFDVSEIMMECYDDPDKVHTVLRKSTDFLIKYAQAFKSAGANGIMIAEPVSGLLSPDLEAEFSAPHVKRIVEAVQDRDFVVIYHNCGPNTPRMTESLISIGAAAYHFGNAVDMKEMLEKFPKEIPVMGNVDPAGVIRMGTPETVREATLGIMNKCCEHPNFVISSGCDIPPMTPWENIDAFFAAVREYYEK